MTLTTTPISPYDLGAIGLIFLIAAGLLKLLTFVVKKKYEADKLEPCAVFKEGVCPFDKDFENMKDKGYKVHDVICGVHAYKDGRPRCYVPEETVQQIAEIHQFVSRLRNTASSHFEHSSGRSGRITKESMAMYHKICSFLEELSKTSKIQIVKEGEPEKGEETDG